MSKTVLITGSSSGIGKATARQFAAKGWNVIATMRKPEEEKELVNGVHMLVSRLDVQDPETITAAIEEGISRFGGIDVLVNNAGYGEFGLFEPTGSARVRNQFEVNVFGVMDTIRTLLPHFRERKAGTILNISSGAGRFTLPLISLYAASQFALEGFSEALSFELSALNIGVKIIEPGGTDTNFINVSNEKASGKEVLSDYAPFLNAAGKMFDLMKGMQLATAEEVAGVIYEAATDGTATLRYAVGNEDFKARLNARFTLPDEAYLDGVRQAYQEYL